MLCLIQNKARDYAWGSVSDIPNFYGRAAGTKPEAEVWLGDHPGSPALIVNTGQPLPDYLASVGQKPLTFLLKLLAAGEVLSIQVHPSKEQAELGFAREEAAGIDRNASNRNYRDDNHKPELIVALSERFTALAGVRPLAQTQELLSLIGPSASALLGQLGGNMPDAELTRSAIAWALSDDAAATARAVTQALPMVSSQPWATELEVYRGIAKLYPGDRGLLVALMLNVVELERGEALALGAGVPHAYVHGFGVELMSASDNVLRGGLTPKHIDVPELLKILVPDAAKDVRLTPRAIDAAVSSFDAGVADFELLRVDLSAGRPVRVDLRSAAIAVQISGASVFAGASSGTELMVEQSDSVFISEDECGLVLQGSGEVFIAHSGA